MSRFISLFCAVLFMPVVSMTWAAEPTEQERIDAAYARLRQKQAEAATKRAATTPAIKPVAEQPATSRRVDRFAKERAAREAELTKEVARLRKAMADEKASKRPIAIFGLGTKNLVEWLDFELKEIKQRPGEWASTVRPDTGSVGRFYRCNDPGNDLYFVAGDNAAHMLKVVDVVDGQDIVAKLGNTQIWIAGVDATTFADGKMVHLPGLFNVPENRKHGSETMMLFVAIPKE